MEVTAKQAQNKDRTFTATYNFGENLDESSGLFTPELVHKSFVKQAVIQLQANMRRWMEAGLPDAEILTKVTEWKPGMVERAAPVDTQKKLVAKFASISAEEKNALIEQLLAMTK